MPFFNFSMINSRKENLIESIFVGDHITYFSLSLSFPVFFHKNSDFPEFFVKFWQFFNSLSFQVCGHPVLNGNNRSFVVRSNLLV